MRLKPSARSAILFICILTLSLPTACKRKEQEASGPSGAQEKKAERIADVDVTGTVAAQIPKNSFGFVLFQAENPGYQKLIQSPWAGGSSISSETILSSPEISALDQSLKGAGIDLQNKQGMAKTFAQTALFLAPGPGEDPIFGGVVSSSEDLNGKLQAIRKDLAARSTSTKVEELSVPAGTALKITVTPPPPARSIGDSPALNTTPREVTFFLAAEGKTASFSNDQQTALSVLKAAAEPAPAVLSAPLFKKGAAGLPADDARFITGYLDLTAPYFKSLARQHTAEGSAGEDLPLQGVVLGMSMKDTPESTLRVMYDPKTDKQKEWVGAISSSKSAAISRLLPEKLLVFLSLDGQTLRKVRDLTLAAHPQPALRDKLAFLDSVVRIGVAARVAPVGQSFLPIPDLMMIFETPNGSKVVESLKTAVTGWSASSGLPTLQWNQKTLNGKPVQFVITPLSVGAFIAQEDTMVIVASAESFLDEGLKSMQAGGFHKAGSDRVKSNLQEDLSVGNIYVNFEELAALAQNMSGVLAAYAPQEQGGKPLMTTERMEEIKRLGIFVGSAKNTPGMLELSGFYETAPSAKSPS